MIGYNRRMRAWLLGFVLLGACAAQEAAAPADLSTLADAGNASDGGLPLFAACTSHDQCASGLCHFYPARAASFCSKPCTTAADCPAPSPGCNMMNVCRIQ